MADDDPHDGTYAKKHSHIEIICQHIMRTGGFDKLLTAYQDNESPANVLSCYRKFIDQYFSEDNLDVLRSKISDEFKCRLQALCQII